MSVRQAVISTLHLFVVLAVFITGLFFVLLPFLPLTRMEIVEFLNYRYEECTQIGIVLFLVSFFLLFGFYAFNRGKYLVIRMGITADLKVIRHMVADCFNKQFPKQIFLKEVEIGPKSRLDFKVHLTPTDEASREKLFVEIEKELGILLQERFSYSKSFHLTVDI